MQHHFLVIGAGSWGTALALVLARNNHNVTLWTKESDEAKAMQQNKENSIYLPGIKFPEHLHISNDLNDAMNHCTHVLIAVPSHAFETVLQQITPQLKQKSGILWATKGLNQDARFLHEVVSDHLGKDFPQAILTGPSFAKEVAENLPTAVTIASNNHDFAQHMQHYFKSPHFRVYLSDDLIGAELGGSVKNVLAISVGIAQGLGFGTNTRAALITRGLAEMMRLGKAIGAKPETIIGLSGLGDLILTCSDLKSRNLRFGTLLGQGVSQTEACKQIGQVIEGLQTTKLIYELIKKYKIRTPIISSTYQILYEQKPLSEALEKLMNQSTENE